MGVVGFIILILLLPNIISGWAMSSSIKRWGRESSAEANKRMMETRRDMAKKLDCVVRPSGILDMSLYSDGSRKYVPRSAGGDGYKIAEKGQYFDGYNSEGKTRVKLLEK